MRRCSILIEFSKISRNAHFVVSIFRGQVQVLIELNELLLDGVVKTLSVCIHLGALGIGQPTYGAITDDSLGKFSLELRSVIGQHPLGLKRIASLGDMPQLSGVLGVFAGKRSPL